MPRLRVSQTPTIDSAQTRVDERKIICIHMYVDIYIVYELKRKETTRQVRRTRAGVGGEGCGGNGDDMKSIL